MFDTRAVFSEEGEGEGEGGKNAVPSTLKKKKSFQLDADDAKEGTHIVNGE